MNSNRINFFCQCFPNINDDCFGLDFYKDLILLRYRLMELNDEIVEQVTDLLGRKPRGLRAVEVVNYKG